MRGSTARASSRSRRKCSASRRRPTPTRPEPMDNLCHTLVGAALGEAGLKHRTRFGNATLMIASNLPDIDVLVFATGTPSVAFRRGWTHSVLADLLLPPLLSAIIVWYARRRLAPAGSVPARPRDILLLAYLGVIVHVLMDLLNNYG